jgi:hypothetical protein
MDLYYEIHGGGHPLILPYGGLGTGEGLPLLAQSQQVIAVERQGQGHPADNASSKSGPVN